MLNTDAENKEFLKELIKSLKRNIITYEKREYLLAGKNQFNSIWIRDLCLSSGSLCKIGLSHIVNNTIELYLNSIDPVLKSGPKGFDTIGIELRTVVSSFETLSGLKFINKPRTFKGP